MKLEIINQKNQISKKGTLVFVHGVCHGAWTWKNFMDYFSAKGYDCYALSLRGHCNSEGREQLNTFTLNDYVDDVLQVLAPFKEDAIVIGHSMGGGVVQRLIGEHPGHAKAAILLASVPPCGQNEQVVAAMIERSAKGINDLSRLSLGETLTVEEVAQCSIFGGRVPIEEVEEYCKFLQNESKIALDELFQPITNSCSSVKIPVGVINSTNDQIFADMEGKITADAYGTKAVMLKDLCHDMMLDPEWEISAEAILEFLEQV